MAIYEIDQVFKKTELEKNYLEFYYFLASLFLNIRYKLYYSTFFFSFFIIIFLNIFIIKFITLNL